MSDPPPPEGYIHHRTGVVTRQDYTPFRGGENLPLEYYQEYISACKWAIRSIRGRICSILDRALDAFFTRVTRYKEEDTLITRGDPNNNIYLSIHRGNVLIKDLEEARASFNYIVDAEIDTIRTAQADLAHELPDNYSPAWHLDSDHRRLINNDTGYYQDP